jgi:uncharacterized repeat protein (TIGR01451 family)
MSAQVMYTVRPLTLAANSEYSAVNALNNQGQAAGWSDIGASDSTRHPFLYNGGTMADLGTFGGPGWSGANGLNNLGQVAGYAYYANGEEHAFLYTGGLVDLTPDDTADGISYRSSANGINDRGQVVGFIQNPNGLTPQDRLTRAFVYSGGTLTVLGATDTSRNTQAMGIDASGEIYGIANNYNGLTGAYGWFYSDGTFTNMFSPCANNCSSVNAMNNSGQVVGGVGGAYRYAFLYNGRTSAKTDLTAASAYSGYGGTANAINDNGQVVGYLLDSTADEIGFIYTAGTYVYLKAFATAPNGSNWNQPQTINSWGQVGGEALGSDGNWHGYVYSNGVMSDVNTLVDPALGVNFHNVSHINDSGLLVATSANYVDYLLTPVLTIVSAHSGNFQPGQQNATYTLTVTNAANAPATSGTVTVTENVPSGLTLVSMSGTGWTCPAGKNTCTRSDALAAGASYPAITVTVSVAAGAASPQVNRASVAEAGIQLGATSDSTVIQALGTSSVTASSATATYSRNDQNVTLTATVTTPGGPVNAGTVSFTVTGIGTVVSGTVTGGSASAVLTIGGATPAGSYSINAVYSGASGIAGSSDATKSLVISNAVPAITWANPADLTFGSALGSGQLDATASVTGIFTYTPPAGTVLPVGANTLSVVFNPNDTVNYSSTSATAIVNVAPGTQTGAPGFVVTRTLSRDSSNNIAVAVSVTNTGGQPSAVTGGPFVALGTCRLGSSSPLSVAGGTTAAILPGAAAHYTVIFPGSTGVSGATVVLTMNGTYFSQCGMGSCYAGSFGSSSRTMLP